MAGTSAGAAKRARCAKCGAFAHKGPHPKVGPKGRSIRERVMEQAVIDGSCLIWPVPGGGRPTTTYRGQKGLVTRFVWEEAHGPIPDGLVVRHSCDRPQCVALGHLCLGTQKDNIHDAIDRGRMDHAAMSPWRTMSRGPDGRFVGPEDGELRVRDVVNVVAR
jgi:hypothetical protein